MVHYSDKLYESWVSTGLVFFNNLEFCIVHLTFHLSNSIQCQLESLQCLLWLVGMCSSYSIYTFPAFPSESPKSRTSTLKVKRVDCQKASFNVATVYCQVYVIMKVTNIFVIKMTSWNLHCAAKTQYFPILGNSSTTDKKWSTELQGKKKLTRIPILIHLRQPRSHHLLAHNMHIIDMQKMDLEKSARFTSSHLRPSFREQFFAITDEYQQK